MGSKQPEPVFMQQYGLQFEELGAHMRCLGVHIAIWIQRLSLFVALTNQNLKTPPSLALPRHSGTPSSRPRLLVLVI